MEQIHKRFTAEQVGEAIYGELVAEKVCVVRRSVLERAGSWSPGYFVSTVVLDEKQISEYVKWQGQGLCAFER